MQLFIIAKIIGLSSKNGDARCPRVFNADVFQQNNSLNVTIIANKLKFLLNIGNID